MLIFLIGFMGSGKSFWGPQWAKSLDMEFADLDKEVEIQAGMTIAEIFDKLGEDAFRSLEQKVMKGLGERDNLLVACGGGTPCYDDNMEWMISKGKTVYLSATPRQLFERIQHDLDGRPLLNNLNEAEVLYFIEKTLGSRLPYYSKADLTLEVRKLEEHSLKSLF
jgi:shikimate kinase